MPNCKAYLWHFEERFTAEAFKEGLERGACLLVSEAKLLGFRKGYEIRLGSDTRAIAPGPWTVSFDWLPLEEPGN